MKGIILAGGEGTRLYPLTKLTSKQLLPVYDRPMIHFPLRTLVRAGITDILVITAPDHASDFERLLEDGSEFDVHLRYAVQPAPQGIAQAFLIAEDFIGSENVTLILGDNIFENDFSREIRSFESGALIFGTEVKDPERFGVIEFSNDMKVLGIEEKPLHPKSRFVVTGLYVYDNTVVKKTKSLVPSARGELEITDINNLYLSENALKVETFEGRWIDAGTKESLLAASIMMSKKNPFSSIPLS